LKNTIIWTKNGALRVFKWYRDAEDVGWTSNGR